MSTTLHRMSFSRHVLFLIGLAVLTSPGFAEQIAAPVFVPAMIGSGANSLHELIDVPEDRRDQTFLSVIRCQVYVEKDGSLDNYLCVRGSIADQDLRKVVQDANEKTSFEPATVDGRTVKVYMNFMVAFECDGGNCEVMILPHHGYHIQELGPDYIAPQAIVNDNFWDKPAWERENELSMMFRTAGYIFFLSAHIDTQGQASDVSIDYVDSAWRTEAKRAATYYGRMDFIPGMHEGNPAAMRSSDFMGLRLRASGGPR